MAKIFMLNISIPSNFIAFEFERPSVIFVSTDFAERIASLSPSW
jgi:hypothetical protein